MKNALLLTSCLGVLLLSGCGPSPTSEGESWSEQEFLDYLTDNIEGSSQDKVLGRKMICIGDDKARIKGYETGRDAADAEREGDYVWGRFRIEQYPDRYVLIDPTRDWKSKQEMKEEIDRSLEIIQKCKAFLE